MKRLAVIDIASEFPARGGAARDLRESLSRLQGLCEIRIFRLALGAPFPRAASPLQLGLEELRLAPPSLDREGVVAAFVKALESWRPDAVFIGDGWMLKPFLALACTARWPTLLRLYALEMLCPRNNECWRHDHSCGNHLLRDADTCRRCVRDYQEIIGRHRGPDGNILTNEQRLARVLDPDYPDAVRQALRQCRSICSNVELAELIRQLKPEHPPVILPGGVDEAFLQAPPPSPAAGVFSILAHGRMDDPAKGAAWLIAAAARLRQEGLPVRLTLTRPPRPESPDWLRETGWIDQPALLRELAAADVAVMPSLWDEAFGLAALEAMAAGLPLIASSAPGPRSFIRHGEDAWLVPPGDEQALLDALRLLHDAPELRRRLGVQARRRAAEFTWDAAAAALGRELRSLLGS
ncbi:MAG: hypothetical protein RL095_3060 [Verrucomicrobiota bacterium]|jgi:glycosyltransferase involved in cell wall biosynthesis